MNEQTSINVNMPVNMPGDAAAITTDPNQVRVCPNCGMPKDEWRGNAGEGFQMGDKVYCCQGCATGTGCTCQ